MATNEPLFPMGTFSLTSEEIDEEHILLLDQMLDQDGQIRERLTKHLMDRLPPDFGIENIRHLASFLSLMLQESPRVRASTAELLSHPCLGI